MADNGFSKKTRRKIAKRAGWHCSYPGCTAWTTGPAEDPEDSTDIGEAAHISGNKEGSSRYDPDMSEDERNSPENGIWLCRNHHKEVDDDESSFTIEELRRWKREAEERAADQLGEPVSDERLAEVIRREHKSLLEQVKEQSLQSTQKLIESLKHGEDEKGVFLPITDEDNPPESLAESGTIGFLWYTGTRVRLSASI